MESSGGATAVGWSRVLGLVALALAAGDALAQARPVTLSVRKTGMGTVTSDPPGIDCGVDCMEGYAPGTMVTLTPVPDPGFGFVRWGVRECPGTAPCTLTLARAQSVTATFASYALSVRRMGSGTVRSDSPGIDCGGDCAEGCGRPDPGRSRAIRPGSTVAPTARRAIRRTPSSPSTRCRTPAATS